jgi:UDP-N-acetylglucosamine acyltransferase
MTDPTRIHPTAIISTEAELADDVTVGPYTVIDGPVRLGPGCVIGPHVHLVGPLTMGPNNRVSTGAVLGERPQHLRYNDEPTRLEVGEGNVFREHVTVHRGTTFGDGVTVIGSFNYLMAHAHVAHDCRVGDHGLLANAVLLGGHCVLGDRVFMGGNSAVHQFSRVGRLALVSGLTAVSRDVPPFVMMYGRDIATGVNVIGMRRAGLNTLQIGGVRKAFRILYHENLPIAQAAAKIEAEFGHIDTVAEFVAFLRAPNSRGICRTRTFRDAGPEREAA